MSNEKKKAFGSMISLKGVALLDSRSSVEEVHNIGVDSFLSGCQIEISVKITTPEGKVIERNYLDGEYEIKHTHEIHTSQMIKENEEFQEELQQEVDRVEEFFKAIAVKRTIINKEKGKLLISSKESIYKCK